MHAFLYTESQDNNQDTESANEETSDISSELDYLDRSVSNTNSTDEDSPSAPRLSLVNANTNEHMPLLQYDTQVVDEQNTLCGKLKSGTLSSKCKDSQSVGDITLRGDNQSDLLYKDSQPLDNTLSRDRNQSQSDVSSGTLSPTCKENLSLDDVLSRDRNLSQSDGSTLISDGLSIQSDESNMICVNKLTQSNDSILDGHDYYASNPEMSRLDFNSLPQIYSTTPLNISDMSLSDASYDRSLTSQGRNQQFSHDSLPSKPEDCPSSEEESRTDSSHETPPLCLDADGGEELDDTSLWTNSSQTLSELDYASLDFFRSIERTYTSQISRESKTSQTSANHMHLLVDSWSDVRPPSVGYVISLDVSDLHIWCVTGYESIFYCPTHYEAISWTQLEGQARMISVNNSGDVIWCVDGKNNAFARKGIREGNLIGNQWLIVEKNIKYVAVDDTAVWGIMLNGDVFVRIEVSKERPGGKTGKTIAVGTDFVQASCLDGLVWFVDSKSIVHVYKGIYTNGRFRLHDFRLLSHATCVIHSTQSNSVN